MFIKTRYCKMFRSLRSFPSVVNIFTIRTIERSFSAESKTVFVGGLPSHFTNEKFDKYLTSVGVVGHTARIVFSNNTQKCRGFGYLDFNSTVDAKNAIDLLSGVELFGKILRADLDTGTAGPLIEIPKGINTIFISGLDTKDKVLIQKFIEEKIGKVSMNIRLPKDDGSAPRRYGHVDFTCPENVDRAVRELDGVKFGKRFLQVEKSEPKNYAPLKSKTSDTGADRKAVASMLDGTDIVSRNNSSGSNSGSSSTSGSSSSNKSSSASRSSSKQRNYEDF